MKPKCKNTKETAPEVPVQEQYVGKCVYCNKIYKVHKRAALDKCCNNCGQTIIYQKNMFFKKG